MATPGTMQQELPVVGDLSMPYTSVSVALLSHIGSKINLQEFQRHTEREAKYWNSEKWLNRASFHVTTNYVKG